MINLKDYKFNTTIIISLHTQNENISNQNPLEHLALVSYLKKKEPEAQQKFIEQKDKSYNGLNLDEVRTEAILSTYESLDTDVLLNSLKSLNPVDIEYINHIIFGWGVQYKNINKESQDSKTIANIILRRNEVMKDVLEDSKGYSEMKYDEKLTNIEKYLQDIK